MHGGGRAWLCPLDVSKLEADMWIYVVGALALPAVGVLVAWQGVKASSAPPCERPQTPPSPPATPAPAKPVHNPYNYPPPGGGFYWT